MEEIAFNKLSSDLRYLASRIPLQWGQIQNNNTDDIIDMFRIESYEELETKISMLNNDSKNYLRRRWYLWKCSECDEYLFYCNANVIKNPNKYDKSFDVQIKDKYKFDIKGTVIPKELRVDAEKIIQHPEEMIDFFYDKQSIGRRYDIQNRLFIVHHSFCDDKRELYLRCAWKSKRVIYRNYCDNIEKIQLYKTHGVLASVVFILERKTGEIEYSLFGL